MPLDDPLPSGCFSFDATVPGNLWKVLRAVGDAVRAGETLAIVESMKMEMRLTSPCAEILREVTVAPGREVRAGQRLFLITLDA